MVSDFKMKRLKSYNRFNEGKDYNLSVINDMSLELTDRGFYFSKFQSFSSKRGDRLSFILNKGGEFYFSDIKDVIEDMISFMESEGWSHRVEFLFSDGYDTPQHGDIDGYVKDGDLYYHSEYDTEEVVDIDCPLGNFILIFFTKPRLKDSEI